MAATDNQKPWFLRYSCPVLFPAHEALTKPQAEFDAFVLNEITSRHDDAAETKDVAMEDFSDIADTATLVTDSTTAEIRHDMKAMEMDTDEATEEDLTGRPKVETKNTFMDLLRQYDERKSEAANVPDMTNKTFTANGDVTNSSTMNHLVDLFAELEDTVSGVRLQNLLQSAWAQDPLMTLKIIFNARSIHLGKSSRVTFYRCAGWLAQNHPATLVANLRWLSRPVIEKKGKKDPEDEDLVVIQDLMDEDDPLRFDIKHGVAHGYWKDLLNILALSSEGELTVLGNPSKVLNPENPAFFRARAKRRKTGKTRAEGKSPEEHGLMVLVAEREARGKKEGREQKRTEVEALFNDDPIYRALHLTVARLFADQLTTDLAALRGNDAKARRNISLCGKWAPSHDRFHDRHTFIVSSIAEVLHPRESFDHVLSPTDTRETYLRYAREEYRKDISSLRKHLDVVERKLSAKEIKSIKYDRLPSKAMQNYAPLFIETDFERFELYLDAVADGKAKISGATLLPSLMVSRQRGTKVMSAEQMKYLPPDAIVKEKIKALESRVADGQWKALVQRIKDSGTLDSCIAIADVSGSMSYPAFADGTTPMDSSIALSLLIAEVARPPYRGSFITFDSEPSVRYVGDCESFAEKVREIESAPWGGSTNFVAVFEDLLLPMAVKNKLRQDEMVKRVFVFSDMQFNEAQGHRWQNRKYTSSLDRIRQKYDQAGYEMPELVFWNLAGGQHDNGGGKPVTVDDFGTSLVSGYSQGMLKVFLDSGSFDVDDDEEEETVEVVEKDENGELLVREETREKKKMDPLATAKKAVGHKAYEMLKVLD